MATNIIVNRMAAAEATNLFGGSDTQDHWMILSNEDFILRGHKHGPHGNGRDHQPRSGCLCYGTPLETAELGVRKYLGR